MSKTLLAKEVREKASLAQELQRKSVELEMEKNKEQQIVDKDAQLARIQEANRRSVSQLHGQLQAQEEELKQLKQKVRALSKSCNSFFEGGGIFTLVYWRILLVGPVQQDGGC